MIGAKCDGTKTPLYDPRARIDGGKHQLADFQRGRFWDAEAPRKEPES